MTRSERLAEAERKAREKIEAERRHLAQVKAAQAEMERKALMQRRQRWGTILDSLGLLQLDEETLKQVLTVAYRLVQEGRVHAAASDAAAEVEPLITDHAPLVLVPALTPEPGKGGDGITQPPETDKRWWHT